MNGPKLVVFDVCNTLYDANTTFDFVRHTLSDRWWFRALDLALLHRASPLYWAQAALYRLGGVDIPRWVMIACLSGFDRNDLRQAAHRYVSGPLATRQIAQTHVRLRQHAQTGDRIVLISNSLDAVVGAIAESLRVEWRASRLAYRGERCVGRLEADLTGRKLGIARELGAEYDPAPELVVYTDNLSDRPLVEAADAATVVIPPRGDRAGWQGVRAEYLVLGR